MYDQLSPSRRMPVALTQAFTKRNMEKRHAPVRGTPLTSMTVGTRTYGPNDIKAAKDHLLLVGRHKDGLRGTTIRMSF